MICDIFYIESYDKYLDIDRMYFPFFSFKEASDFLDTLLSKKAIEIGLCKLIKSGNFWHEFHYHRIVKDCDVEYHIDVWRVNDKIIII